MNNNIDVSQHDSDTVINNGNLDEALHGNYNFLIGKVFSTAWHKVKGFKGSAWAAAIIFLIINAILVGIYEFIFPSIHSINVGLHFPEPDMYMHSILKQLAVLVQYFLIMPLIAGLWMLAIKRVSNKSFSYTEIFKYYPNIIRLFILYFIQTIIVMLSMFVVALIFGGIAYLIGASMAASMRIGTFFGVLPVLYLSVAYIFSIPLLIEKKLSFWQALETSRRVVTHHWFKLFFLVILLGIIVSISILPIFIGLIWSLPFTLLVYGVLYRHIFGTQYVELSETTPQGT